MAFSTDMGFTPTEAQTKVDCYDAGAAAVWSLIGDFLGTTAAERKIARIESATNTADMLSKYTPETLAKAMNRISTLRDSVTFHQGDILENANGVRITVITADTATGNKEGVTPTGKCYTITSVFDWTKTGETNQGLIAALDDIDAEEPNGGE